jgi:hypothetical protein
MMLICQWNLYVGNQRGGKVNSRSQEAEML